MLDPVFILGCGRSGTTILGNTLSAHPKITFLNEPRDLWFSAYPRTDIWTNRAVERRGKLVFGQDDVSEIGTATLTESFSRALAHSGRSVLIEKLPINNFRANFIRGMFPSARFIYIWRNGCEVAESIETICLNGGWFAGSDYKWKLLSDYAKQSTETEALPDLCNTYYQKGLLEWRLSVSAAVGFLSILPKAQFVTLSYADFTVAPLGSIKRILDYLRLDLDANIKKFANENVSRRRGEFRRELTDLEWQIGGPQLAASLAACPVGFLPDPKQFAAGRRPS
jgi:hypothetical protein